jgi:NADH-ubiquinone oxidoreductase chain 4
MKSSNLYILLILLIGILLWINFLTLELLSYYILFESTLIPLFILIGIYGSLNKEKAAYYILLYTLLGSLFMLLSICITTYLLKSTNYYVYNGLIISLDLQIIL